MEKLITDYRYELEEDHHSFGSGRYGVVIKVTNDISPAMPYLNAVLTETRYDRDNNILIGAKGNKRYAFRPHEIRAPMVPDPKDAPAVTEEVVEMVNRVWGERADIEPTYRERSLPNIYDIFRCLPKTNCRQCGCPTCLAFAAKVRGGESLDVCILLSKPEYSENRAQVEELLAGK